MITDFLGFGHVGRCWIMLDDVGRIDGMGTRSNRKIFYLSASGGRLQKTPLEGIQTALEWFSCVWWGFIRRYADEA